MFTELYQLIQKANLKNISLTLQDEGNGKMAVTVMTQNNVGDAADPKLRQALTQPLKVAASPMLLDEEFIKHLNSFSESYVEATVTANTGNVTETMSNATHKQADPVAAATTQPSEQDIEQPEQATNLNDIDLED
mgnify:FL=1